MIPRYFNPYEEIKRSANRLPHWEQPGAMCFLTFRLGDSLPSSKINAWEHERAIWLKLHPEPWDDQTEMEYHLRFTMQIEHWLDAGYGACLLRDPDNRDVLSGALQHFDRVRYLVISFVVMPNHIHALVLLNPDWPLGKLMHSWKSWSSKQIMKRAAGLSGGLWQKDYHDRLIRDDPHFRRVVRYIRANPSRAKLKEGEYTLWESDWARKVE